MAPEVIVCETNKDNPYDYRVRERKAYLVGGFSSYNIIIRPQDIVGDP